MDTDIDSKTTVVRFTLGVASPYERCALEACFGEGRIKLILAEELPSNGDDLARLAEHHKANVVELCPRDFPLGVLHEAVQCLEENGFMVIALEHGEYDSYAYVQLSSRGHDLLRKELQALPDDF